MLRNLKLQIFLSFFGLISIGMCLLAFVLLVLWHNDIVTLQVAHLQYVLNSVKVNSENAQRENSEFYDTAVIKRILEEEMVSCLVMWKGGELYDAPHSCSNQEDIKSRILKTVDSGEDTFTFKEKSLGHYFPSKQSYVATSAIVVDEKTVAAFAMTGTIESIYSSLTNGLKIALVYIFVNAILLTVVGFFRMLKFFIRPLEQVVNLADEYSDTSSTAPIKKHRSNEFNQVAFSLKQMMKRIEADNLKLRSTINTLQTLNDELNQARSEVIRAEKLASVGRLSAGFAHEVGNPLGIIKGYLDLLREENIPSEESAQFIARAQKEVLRIETIVSQLLDCSRQQKIKRGSVNICEILQDLLNVFQDKKISRRINFSGKFNVENIKVNADHDSLRQVFLNCLLNSVDAIEEKNNKDDGHILVEIQRVSERKGHHFAVIEISDNGVGVDPLDQDNVFDPFFTTKEPGKGTGLGLSVSYTIIEQFGGEISLRNLENGGVCVTIELPCENVDFKNCTES